MEDKVREYIVTQEKAGYTDEQIKSALKSNGYTDIQIKTYFPNETSSSPTQEPINSDVKPKRTGTVWLFSLLTLGGIIQSILEGISLLNNPIYSLIKSYQFWMGFTYFAVLIPGLIFIIYFFLLRKTSIIWLYIAYGFPFIINIVLQEWVTGVVYVILIFIVRDYILHKKINDVLLFK